eukprot:6194622-Pleurochrysis_carterae.AAC.1
MKRNAHTCHEQAVEVVCARDYGTVSHESQQLLSVELLSKWTCLQICTGYFVSRLSGVKRLAQIVNQRLTPKLCAHQCCACVQDVKRDTVNIMGRCSSRERVKKQFLDAPSSSESAFT